MRRRRGAAAPSSTWPRAATRRSTSSSRPQRTSARSASSRHDLARAVVVGDRVPRSDVRELEELLARARAVDPGRLPCPRRGAEAERRDEEAAAVVEVHEVERHDRDDLAAPRVDRLVVDAADHVGRVQAQVAPDGRRRRCRTAAAAPATRCRPPATTTVGAVDAQPGALVAGAHDRVDAGRAAVLGRDALDEAVHDEARAGRGGVLEVGAQRRALAALLAAGVAVAAEVRVVVQRRVARDRVVREAAGRERLDEDLGVAVEAGRLGVDAQSLVRRASRKPSNSCVVEPVETSAAHWRARRRGPGGRPSS